MLYDLQDEEGGGGGGGKSAAASAAVEGAAASSGGGGGDASEGSRFSFGAGSSGLQEPQHSIADVAAADDKGPGRLEVQVDMPEISSAAEVAVDTSGSMLRVSVPGLYRLQVRLPCAVDDSATKAKWNKTRHRLTIMLPKK